MDSDASQTHDDSWRSEPGRTLVVVAVVAAVYFITAKLGLRLAFVSASATAVWPPTGIAPGRTAAHRLPGMAPQGRVETLQQHDVIIASLKGDVDLSNVGEIRARLLTAIPNAARACVLDISETTYLDSKGLQLLLDTAYRLEIRGQRFLLVVPEHAPVQRLRRLVSISRTIPIVPSLSEAFARLGAPLAADHGS